MVCSHIGGTQVASRAMSTRNTQADWRVGLRRSIRRAAQMTGAGVLLLTMIFIGLALASYTQTDPSPSTAADPAQVSNWMGVWGAWGSRPRAVCLWASRPTLASITLCFRTKALARGRTGR